MAGWTLIGSSGSGAAVSSVVITVGAGGVPAGALIVVFAAGDYATVGEAFSIADSAGNSYTQKGPFHFTAGTYTQSGVTFYVYNSLALVNTNTITVSNNVSYYSNAAIAFYRTDALTASDPLDTYPTPATGTSTSPSSNSSGTLAQANEAAISVTFAQSASTASFTWTHGTGWAALPSVAYSNSIISTYQGIWPEWQDVNATTALTGTATLGVSIPWAQIILTFKLNAQQLPPALIINQAVKRAAYY